MAVSAKTWIQGGFRRIFAPSAAGCRLGWVLTIIFALGPMHLYGAASVTEEPQARAVLTNVLQVLNLGTYLARHVSQPVRLRGTVLYVKTSYLFLRDDTASILVIVTNTPADLVAGKLAEVEGWTEAGLYAPLVDRAAVRITGESPLPPGKKLPVARMKAGEGCWQWVRVEGVVRDMNRDAVNLALSIAAQNQRFNVFVFDYERFRHRGLPLEWLEARVVIDAVCWIDVNDGNQPIDFHLVMTDTNQIHFVKPGTTNLFAREALHPADALSLRQPSDQRLHLAGTVLAIFPDNHMFLRTPFGPVQAWLYPPISRGMPSTELVPHAPPEALAPGDRIEMIGAPAQSRFAPLLVDAEYRRVGTEGAPAATSASRLSLIHGEHDADLIRIVGRLLGHERRQINLRVEEALLLQTGETVFEAAWLTERTNALPTLPINAQLAINGICLVQPGPGDLRRTFKVLLRNAADVTYLGQTPFWAQPGVSRLLGIGSALGILGGLWVVFLRRKVRERTADLASANLNLSSQIEERRKAQSELKQALAAERELSELKSRFVSLVSHEFRTPLGITMSAVELLRNYLDRLPPEKFKELLEDIYSSTLRMSGLMEQVLVLGRVEAGKLAINSAPIDLNAFGLQQTDEVVSAFKGRCPVRFANETDLSGAQADEALLRHIFSNLLSNAVKYSPDGSPVDFTVKRDDRHAVFMVRDRGIGIPETDQPRLFQAFHRGTNVGQISGTGLGLLIVKRCVELHGGTIHFHSRPGEGTIFFVHLPLFETEL